MSARTRVAARLLVCAANFWKRMASLGAVLTNSATPQTRTHRALPLLTHWLGGCSATLPLVLLKLLLRALGADRDAMRLKAVVKWWKGNSCGRPREPAAGLLLELKPPAALLPVIGEHSGASLCFPPKSARVSWHGRPAGQRILSQPSDPVLGGRQLSAGA